MKKELIALLKKLGLLPDDKEKAFTDEFDKLDLEKTPAKSPEIDASKITDPVIKQMIEALNAQIGTLTQQNKSLLDTLTAEKKAREDAMKTQSDELKKQQTQKVTDIVAKAKKEQKIATAKETWFKAFAEKDYEAAEAWLKDAPIDKHAAAPAKDDKTGDAAEKKVDRVAGPLGSVNQTILKNVLESSAAQN